MAERLEIKLWGSEGTGNEVENSGVAFHDKADLKAYVKLGREKRGVQREARLRGWMTEEGILLPQGSVKKWSSARFGLPDFCQRIDGGFYGAEGKVHIRSD